MKKLILILSIVPTIAFAQVKQTGWTTTTNPATARAALGIDASFGPTNGIPKSGGTGTNTALIDPVFVTPGVTANAAGFQTNSVVNTNDFAEFKLRTGYPGRRTPRLGFNTWPMVGSSISQTLITNIIQYAKTNGLLTQQYPFDLMGIDDSWCLKTGAHPVGDAVRDSSSNLVVNTTLFPQGFPWLVTYARTNGARLGLFFSLGRISIGNMGGSFNHWYQDATNFHAMGFQSFKLAVDDEGMGIPVQYKYKNFVAGLQANGWPYDLEIVNAAPVPSISYSPPAWFFGVVNSLCYKTNG
ncbi:MAG: hypothetical protein H7X97_07105, partial [Opitutaceae bacterium]|nr:hypothetical protein [Verrucomicrobiales bacterium]